MKTLADIIDGDPLIRLLDKVILEEHENEPPRNYLGASSIGDECSRKLWYKYKGHKENFDVETIRRFADGHRTEEVILGWLRHCKGIELYTTRDLVNGSENNEANGNPKEPKAVRGIQLFGETDDGGCLRFEKPRRKVQIGFTLFEGRFAGHYDAIGRGFPQAPKTWHIVEIKCVNEKSFKELEKLKAQNEKTAIELWKPEYADQVQIYMHMEKLTRSIHIVSTPGARNLISVRSEYNKDRAEVLLMKAKRIIDSKVPLEKIGGKDFWKCKMCSFRKICHE